jgi:hypothetical protein
MATQNPGPRFVFTGRIGIILLALWLIITGAAVIVHLTFSGFDVIMAIIAIIAGVFILVGI